MRYSLLTVPYFLLATVSSGYAQPAPATQLPLLPQEATSLPPAAAAPAEVHTPAASSAVDSAVAVAVATADPSVGFSYGRAEVSVLFLPEQIAKMKEALRAYEGSRGAKTDIPLDQPLGEPLIKEPATYPVFYLSSLAYHSSNDWTIWVSGHKITPKKNDTDLTVISVSANAASFTWKPVYGDIIDRRTENKLFASTDPIKHRLAHPDQHAYEASEQTFTFTLRPNQTFAVGYQAVIEGYIDSPAMPVLVEPTAATPAATAPAGDAPPAAGAAGLPSNLQSELKDPSINKLYQTGAQQLRPVVVPPPTK